MVLLRPVLASLLLLCDPLAKISQSWGVGDLSFPHLWASNDTCPAGRCEGPEEEGEVRGAPSRPDLTPKASWWPLSFEWFIKLSLRLISDAAATSLHYCGTLCASIGLAARWSYWLAVASVALFMLQLLVWTCNWVLIPLFRHGVAFWRYVRGQGQWYELAQIHGVRVFRPKWIGPQGREDWTAAYVQQEVRGRGEGREPFDLLVTDGTAIARLRHGTLRGRTNRFGFRADCDSVHASSHRYYRNQLEGMECRVHLCSQRPCGQPDDDCLHAVASAVIPRHLDFDLQDAAGKGPMARCATAAWLCGYSTCGLCGSAWKATKRCLGCVFCSGCLCKRKNKARNRMPPSSGTSTPRHENSETESEAEGGLCCQAESVAFLANGKPTPLSLVPCKDAARGDKVKLLPSDAEISSAEDLKHEDGQYYFNSCHHHRALYEGQAAKRTCVYEGCDREVKASKGGLRLCKLHGAKEERARPSSKMRNSSFVPKATHNQAQVPEPEARIAPGLEAPVESSSNSMQASPQATLLGKYLRSVLDGQSEPEALQACANPGCGPRETWEDLKDQATAYVARLPKDYPAKARKAIVNLVTEDCPIHEWPQEVTQDPVLGLGAYAAASSGERAPERAQTPATPAVEVLPPVTRPPQASDSTLVPNVLTLYRPRGSTALPEGLTLGTPTGQPNAYTSFAAVARPRHIGAYTDGEPPRMDETTKALQAIAKAVTSKDEAASHDKGKLASIGKVEERLIYLVRGCDALTVPLGRATVGKELFHSLRATSTQGRPQLRVMQFPVNINNRVAYGLSSMSIGGKDSKSVPDFCLSVADFPLTSEEEFDGWVGCTDMKLEKRPKPPMTLNAWYRNALRESWAIACVYGSEHYSSFEQAASFLLKLGEDHAYMWPAHAIFSVWEELWSRYVEELKDLDRELRRAMKEDSPTFERIRFFVTAPGEDGEPWLRLPRTFFLEDGNEYFQTDVIPRHNRMLSRACWQVALKKGPSGGLYGGKAGEGPEASDSRPGPKAGKADTPTKGLLGPPLTNKEAARALDHRPKERKGPRYLCWDHLCHRGCAKPSSCPHSHGAAPKWDQIDWAVQLQLLRRGGLRSQPKLSESQVSEQMEAIRKVQHQKAQDMINDGKKIKKVGEHQPNEGDAEPKVGQQQDLGASQEAPPEEFTRIFPTDQEAELTNLLEGPDLTFFDDHDGGKATREAQSLDSGVEEVDTRRNHMLHVEQSALAEGFDGLLKTYVKNQLLLKKEDDPQCVLSLEDVRAALEQARINGCPALSTAADEALQGAQMSRAGYSPNVGHLSAFQWHDDVGQGLLTWAGGSWEVWDYGDKLYPSGQWPKELLSPNLLEEGPESRQCLLLHCAAGYLHSKTGKIPQWHEVQRCTNELRAELVQQASEASRHLGECPDTMPRSEADLRVFVHDLLHWSHDKDYRTLASFPAGYLLDKTLYVIRMASDYDLSTEVITGALSSGHPSQQIHLLVHQGHMRLLTPKGLERNPPTIREVIAAGWECHLEAADGSEASVRARDYLSCPRCSQAEEVPRRSGTRPPSVLGLHLQSDASDKIGAWAPGTLELKDVPSDQWTDDDLRAWLGPQSAVFDKALSSGLDLLEVYAGKARASQAVLSRGGCALYLGLDHGHDFRRARDRSLAVALVLRLKPRHLWGAFPCTPFCAWIRLALLRNCDMTHRLKEGRLHLRFILHLCGLQLDAHREAHLENPLTSMAWKEPLSLEALADPRWLRARLDQCQTGLSSPTGGLHLKPTLIRTTDPLMQSTLSLTCPRDHPHDPVEGAATAMSAMHSPHMADLIAQVVLSTVRVAGFQPPVDVSGGGGGAAFSSPAVRVGASEASFSPGQPNSSTNRWFEGLKCEMLKGPMEPPLAPDVEQACKVYLEFVSSEPYSKATFRRGAELGTKVLNEAGGWKEANRGIRRTWMQMKGDHFEGLHSDFFEGLVAPNLLEKARENAIWGISARYEGGVGNRVQCGPHPSLKEHLDEAAQQLWKDAAKGRVLLCFDEGGDELHGVVSVAMARVPKMLPNRTVSDKGRVIWDAKPINEFCDKGRHPPALQPKHDEVARLIVWWQTRFPNTPILLSKKDVSDAFKWVPVRCEDTRLFAADLPGGEFGAQGKNITVLYNSLTFGWTGAPGEYMLFAWLIKSGHSMFHPPDPEWNDGVAFQSLVLMDDAVLIEPKVGLRPWLSVQTMETCTKKALGPGSINAAKDEIEGALETRKLIWGLMYDTERNTRALPPQKLEKASYLLHLPEFDYGNMKVPLKLIQELRGNQQFWVSVLPSLKPLLAASNALLGPPSSDGLAQPRGDAEQQRRTWIRFWEAIELQRLLVDNRAEWGVRFTPPMTEALSIRELLAMPGHQQRVVWASGDATLERIGAVDWSHKQAYALEVAPYQKLIEEMEREALEDVNYPRRVSRPGDGDDEDEPQKLMVALTELLAVLILAVCQHERWHGKVILYMGDNQVVVKWINSRQARHPFASYLLQVLAAVEACYGFHLHTAYLRTYHNVVADALTRQDAEQVIREAGLEALPPPDQHLQRFLDRGWQRRALVWAGQADADSAQACRLAETRKPSNLPKPLAPVPVSALEVNFIDLGEISKEYVAALHSSGARPIKGAEGSPRRVSRPGEHVLVCITLSNPGWKDHVGPLVKMLEQPNLQVDLLWADSRDRSAVEELGRELKGKGFTTTTRSVCGRSLLDQVWWKRWIVTATKDGERPFPWVLTEDEPCTPPLAGYPLEWLVGDEKIEDDRWEPGLLKLDSSMPYLGATKPKPIGTLMRPREGRALVWDPRKPLPGLHEGSADVDRKDRLLLLGKGPDGPAARAILPSEVIHLAGGIRGEAEQTSQEDVKKALATPPRALCESAVSWASTQVETKVGVCKLQWEEESRNILNKWLTENPASQGSLLVGGKSKKSKNKGLPVNERAMKAMSYVLRHSAGTEACPITEEGWVRWDDLRRHESCQPYDAWTLWDAIEADAKDRVVASQDDAGEWWVAAWSGHTQERVVGPAAVVPIEELPKVLTHGSYRRHTASIQKKGLLRQTRDLHFHDPDSRTGKWRLDLETCVRVNVKLACEHGCVFRRTGNDVWLCDKDVPPAAILSITEWDKPRDVPPSGMLFDLKKREESRRSGKGGSSSSAAGSTEYNPAALDIPAYRPWQPKLRPNLVTEEIASTAYEIGKNLPENTKGGIEIDPTTEAIRPRQLAACIAPGGPGEEEECDWSADDSDVLVVKATPAAGLEPKVEEEEDDTSMENEEEDKTPVQPLQEEKVEGSDVEMEGAEEPSSSQRAEASGHRAGEMEGIEEPNSSKGVEALEPKAEELHEEAPEPVRRRKIKFGSAHLQLLRAVADADAHNWESLQMALNSTPSSAKAKSELVERLEHLADLRVKSLVDAEKSAQEHAKRAKHYTEAETQYQRGLNDAMLRLEKMNPVGPRTSVPLVSEARLRQDIEAGTPIWVARRAHRARERAARRRLDEPRTTMDASQPSALTEVAPEEGGQMLDDAFAASAKANLTEFKKILKEEAKQEKEVRKRKPDSERRKKIKKDRRKAKKANTKDDAERDQNHAIAHRPARSEASFSPGLQGVVIASLVNMGQSTEVDLAGQETSPQDQWSSHDGLLTFDFVSGMVFDLVAVTLLMIACWVTYRAATTLRNRILKLMERPRVKPRAPSPSRRVGNSRKRVHLLTTRSVWVRGAFRART
eukprot:Skav231659  [mRNA]  locus=scaffold823:44885:57127:- [translate_table: standard]